MIQLTNAIVMLADDAVHPLLVSVTPYVAGVVIAKVSAVLLPGVQT